ncbi:MAG: sarcosine oxidase subunit gamma [Actinophytocola sp.]|nr:sarcosine oxidase subunit gamma [Actinophytocola sp.]
MTADIATRRSPLDGWTSRLAELAPAVRLAERPFVSQLTLRLPDSSRAAAVSTVLGVELPSAPCTFAKGTGPHGPVEVCWLGPDEYLVLAQPGLQRTLESALRAAIGDAHGAVVDVSAQRTTLTLSGPNARDLLAHGCAVDLHPSVSPTGTCVQTLLAQAGIILLVREAEFVVLVRASFATYLAAWLLDAGTEYREQPT